MAVGKKLLLSLSVFAIRQRKRLPDGSLVKRQPSFKESWIFQKNKNNKNVVEGVHSNKKYIDL